MSKNLQNVCFFLINFTLFFIYQASFLKFQVESAVSTQQSRLSSVDSASRLSSVESAMSSQQCRVSKVESANSIFYVLYLFMKITQIKVLVIILF